MAVCKNKEDCLSIWEVLARWQHVSLEEFAELVNSRRLPAYRVLHPHSWDLDERTLTLRAIEGRVTFEGNEYIDIVREDGRVIDANAVDFPDDNGDPIHEARVYFLVDDVARTEEGRYVAEPLKAPEAPARRVGKLLRAADAAAMCAISESEWWRWVAEGRMPQGIKVKPKLTVWPEAEIEDALARIVEKARQ